MKSGTLPFTQVIEINITRFRCQAADVQVGFTKLLIAAAG